MWRSFFRPHGQELGSATGEVVYVQSKSNAQALVRSLNISWVAVRSQEHDAGVWLLPSLRLLSQRCTNGSDSGAQGRTTTSQPRVVAPAVRTLDLFPAGGYREPYGLS